MSYSISHKLYYI